ncbi:hypothetical protein HKD37_14G040250 [Glycine soja]
MGPLQRQAFRKVYGKILDLTVAEVFMEAVVSLAQYYDQPLRCFTFGDFQKVPTIEEFEKVLGCPLGGRKPYLFSGFLPSLSKIATVVGDSAKELDHMKQTRNGVVSLPRKYLESKARDMASQEKWGPFADILALLIFGVVLFPNVDGLVDLAAIDAFVAYHHSKESPVVAILADLFDTFDRRCEKNSARIVCCLPALCVWLVSNLFQQDTRHPCPLQSYRSCAEKGRVDWDQHLAGIGGTTINWFPRWKEGKEGVLFSCGDYPNVPLIGTRGCINYNPALAIRQLAYPMRGAPTEESLSSFLVRDLGAQSLKVIQRVHKVWRSPLKKDKELRGIRNGVIGGYHGWLRVHTRGLDWLSKLKVINEENFEAPEKDEEVQALKLELGKARLAKEKFKSAATHIRKECTESKRSLAQHLEATEQSMLAIIGQYKEELNQSVAHEQKLVEDFAQVYAEKEARWRVIDALHQEATMWMDRFALTLNGSQDLPRLLAKAKAMAEVCTAPEEINGLINYCQHMIDLMAHIIRNHLATQVVPSMTEREMITIMVDTLPTFYYGKLIGYMPANFADLVFAGERIESGLRKGKFEYASNKRPSSGREEKGRRRPRGHHRPDVDESTPKYPKLIPAQSPKFFNPSQEFPPDSSKRTAQRTAPAAPQPVNNTAPGASYKYAQHPPPKDNFSPIPMAYSELWPSLLENHLVVAIPGKVLQPPYPKWYDLGAKCAYHNGVPGHNIDSCILLKYKVQHLISAGWLSFQEEGPNVKTNPLASHGGASVNAVEEDGPSRAKRLREVATSRRFIYQSLQAACMVSRGGDKRDECLFHLGESHDMETCPAVEELLQRFMDFGQLEVSRRGREEPQICMQSEEKKVPLTPKALVICFTRKGTGSTPMYPRTVPKPTPFAYQSNKAVLWKYTPPASSERVATEVDSLSAKVTNITGLMAGRVFASPHPAELPSKGKAPMIQEPIDVATPSKEVDSPVVRGVEKKEGLQGKTVTLEEAHEFLRLIQQREFKVVEQLNKTPARISLLELLINSEPHPHDILVEGFEGIVNHITTNNYIAFAEEEIRVEGRGHNKALHVSVRCMDHVVVKVLIDNGSSLNVMLKTTLEKLPSSASRLKPSSMVVRAFDGTRREVMGEIDIPIQIGPHTCNVVFHVMDINPAYSCLLGRPWIHALGVVPSTLHQKLKFVVGGLLVIVSGEEDLLVSCPSSAPYVEAAEESLETAFQSFKVVRWASVEPSSLLPSLSNAAIMVARVMLRNRFEPGMGLGKDGLGNANVVDIKVNSYKYGLGYEPGMPGRRNVPSRLRADRVWPGRISQCFTSAGMVSEEEVATIEEEFPQDPPSFVQPCHPDSQVGNWRVISQYEGRFFEDPNNEGLTIDFDRDISQTINEEEEEDVRSPELERLVAQEEREMKPHQEEIELVNLGTTEEKKEVKVGTGMTAPIRQGLITLLEEYRHVFAWSYQDMPGLDSDIVQHKLPLNTGSSPVKQKL